MGETAETDAKDDLNPRMVRKQTGLGRSEFASLLGMGEQGYADWEEGKRTPGGPARRLLSLVRSDPEGMAKKLSNLP